jgi:hypothetical protein
VSGWLPGIAENKGAIMAWVQPRDRVADSGCITHRATVSSFDQIEAVRSVNPDVAVEGNFQQRRERGIRAITSAPVFCSS